MKKRLILVIVVSCTLPNLLLAQEIPHPYSGGSPASRGNAYAENVFLILLIITIAIMFVVAVNKYRKSS